jgi:hypothetical protein
LTADVIGVAELQQNDRAASTARMPPAWRKGQTFDADPATGGLTAIQWLESPAGSGRAATTARQLRLD